MALSSAASTSVSPSYGPSSCEVASRFAATPLSEESLSVVGMRYAGLRPRSRLRVGLGHDCRGVRRRDCSEAALSLESYSGSCAVIFAAVSSQDRVAHTP